MGAYQNAMKRFGHTKLFATVFKPILPHIDRVLSRLTRGRWTLGESVAPTLILLHTGHKSGRGYRTPLAYAEVNDAFVLIGSNWGQPHHPGWSANLLHNPDVRVVVDGETVDVRARRVTGDEKSEVWKHMVAMWPAYDTYVTRSGRDLRVFVLERRA